jgi:hypothetical protein
MALPLPKVVSDVGPGGPLVTAMGGMNSLANDMLLQKINQVKAKYAPMTTQAEAASKLAYANMMGPQFVAKILGNENLLAGMGDANAKAALAKVLGAGMGQGGVGDLNALNQTPQGGGFGQSTGNSLLGWLTDRFKNAIGSNQGISPQLNRTMQGIDHVESGGAQNPYSLIGKDTGKGDHAYGKHQILGSNIGPWTKEALGKSMTPQEFLASPEAQDKTAAYIQNKYLNAGHSPQDVASIWFTGKPLAKAGNVHDSYGTTNSQYIKKFNEGINQAADKTIAEKTADFQGTKAQGVESGKIRARSQDELDNEYQQALNMKTPIDTLGGLIANPKFQNMRNLPGFQKLQLDVKSNFGTPEEQEMAGKWTQAARALVSNTIKGFGGRILASEIPLAESMKLADKDTNGVLIGKWPGIKAFNDMTLLRSRIASKLIEQKHLNKGDALEMADKMVNGEAIRKQAEKQLDYSVTITNSKTGEKRTVPVSEARKLGVPNV